MKSNIFFAVKFLLFSIIIIGAILYSIYYFSQFLLIDKESKSNIDEGIYILTKLSYDYEALLKDKEKLLQSEREKLLLDRKESRTYLEKLEIEKKLKEIENQRKQLNQEFEQTKKEKMDIEENLKTARETSNITNEQFNDLNKRYQDLQTDKESSKKYWDDYMNELKNIMLEHYKFNIKKKDEIDKGFQVNNGKEIVIKEYSSFFNIIAEKDKQIKDLSRNSSKEISDIQKELASLKNKAKSLETNIDESKASSEFYINFHREYSQTINDFNRVLEYFKNANELIKNNKEINARDEFKKAIDVFNEIRISFQKIKEIEKKMQNNTAAELYNKVNLNLKNKKYDAAYQLLTEIISKNPYSDYIDRASSDLLKISNSISDNERTEIANRYASDMLRNAEALEKQKKYQEAIDICHKLIIDYPYSNYVGNAIVLSKGINEELKKNNIEAYNNELKLKFEEDYKKYIEFSNKQDYEKARKYYFAALNNSLNYLTNDTINNFKIFEDKYIELIIKNSQQ